MNSNRFLLILFSLAIFYQFFCNNFSSAENNTKTVKINIIESSKKINVKKNANALINVKNNIKKNSNRKYRMSKAGLDFIKSKETCVLTAYNDPDPKRRSVGWGHQIQPGESLEHITQKKADELFEKDIEWVNGAINRLIKQHDRRFIYSQGFIDGLGSLIYNCGERGVTLTEFWNRWSRCRYDKNTPGFINQNHLIFTIAAVKTSRISAKGHIERRYDEHKLMLN